MGEGLLVRTFGSGLQAISPTITEISNDVGEIVFTIKNENVETAIIVYETNDELPDKNSIKLAAGATSNNITIKDLNVSPVILYASANVVGKVKSNITQKSFTFTPKVFTIATGGEVLEYDLTPIVGGETKRYRTHTFLENGDFTVTTVGNSVGDYDKVEFIIVGGGGTGPTGTRTGGGGGGGYISSVLGEKSGQNTNPVSRVVLTQNTFPIVIGAAENNSSAFSLTAFGGGNGGAFSANGSNGASGGGAGNFKTAVRTGGTGFANQGFNGGNTAQVSQEEFQGGGGGGGAMGAGGNGGFNSRGGGGAAAISNIRTGNPNSYSGGGGGHFGFSNNGATFGAENSGGGGGGGTGAANSGIVVIRYEIATIT